MGVVHMKPPDNRQAVPVPEYYVKYREALGWKRLSEAQATKINEQGQPPAKDGK